MLAFSLNVFEKVIISNLSGLFFTVNLAPAFSYAASIFFVATDCIFKNLLSVGDTSFTILSDLNLPSLSPFCIIS